MSFPNLSGRFQSAAVLYDRYRLAYPQRLIARLAGLAGLKPGDAVLDLGCGTGMLAVAFAKIGMAVTAMDPQSEMLVAAGSAAQAAQVALALVKGGSQDLTPQMGPFALVVMGRSFHWMDRAATLAMLDRIVAPQGGVALFHDTHPPLAENGWFKTLCAVQDKYRQTMPGDRRGGHRRYEPFLFESAFTRIDGLSVTIRQPLTAEEIVGRALSMSACAPQMLGEAAEEFAACLSSALRDVSPDGKFIEVAELVAVLARRAKHVTGA